MLTLISALLTYKITRCEVHFEIMRPTPRLLSTTASLERHFTNAAIRELRKIIAQPTDATIGTDALARVVKPFFHL